MGFERLPDFVSCWELFIASAEHVDVKRQHYPLLPSLDTVQPRLYFLFMITKKEQSRGAQITWMVLTIAGIIFVINQRLIWAGIGSVFGK
jgi:hypothetical protein